LSLRDGTRRLGESHFARGRQAHFDGGAAFWPIVGRDVAAVLLDDPVTDTQAQPGSFAHSLRRIERIKDAVGILDANSRVQELNPHLSITAVNPYADLPALSAFENRVYRIIDDVKKHLLQLMRIGGDAGHFRRRVALYQNVIHLKIVIAQG